LHWLVVEVVVVEVTPVIAEVPALPAKSNMVKYIYQLEKALDA
jgi:hypothetical protein